MSIEVIAAVFFALVAISPFAWRIVQLLRTREQLSDVLERISASKIRASEFRDKIPAEYLDELKLFVDEYKSEDPETVFGRTVLDRFAHFEKEMDLVISDMHSLIEGVLDIEMKVKSIARVDALRLVYSITSRAITEVNSTINIYKSMLSTLESVKNYLSAAQKEMLDRRSIGVNPILPRQNQ